MRFPFRTSPPRVAVAFALLLIPALGCTKSEHSGATVTSDSTAPPSAKEAPVAAPSGTVPAHITVQHILIGFQGSVPGKNITRSKDEAKTLAYQLLERAKKGEDFDTLVRQYTDDAPPGIYKLAGSGVTPVPGEYPRDQMVPAFGNVGFKLQVGEIGIADYSATESPYGYHVIKRLE
ncbi:MAG: peptidylprolyl isomerase [Bacteroidota bacterium]